MPRFETNRGKIGGCRRETVLGRDRHEAADDGHQWHHARTQTSVGFEPRTLRGHLRPCLEPCVTLILAQSGAAD